MKNQEIQKQIMRKELGMLISSGILMLCMSLSVLGMPYASMRAMEGNRTGLRMVGIAFWGFAVGAYCLYHQVSRCRKRQQTEDRVGKRPQGKEQKIGIFSFGASQPALCIDIIMLISLAGLVVSFLVQKQNEYVTFAMLSASLFFVQMHGLLNGKNYAFVKTEHGRGEYNDIKKK